VDAVHWAIASAWVVAAILIALAIVLGHSRLAKVSHVGHRGGAGHPRRLDDRRCRAEHVDADGVFPGGLAWCCFNVMFRRDPPPMLRSMAVVLLRGHFGRPRPLQKSTGSPASIGRMSEPSDRGAWIIGASIIIAAAILAATMYVVFHGGFEILSR
jgi:hypothetical protein